MEQLLAHLVGDYLLQSHWMASNKRFSSLACWMHVNLYTFCFLFIIGWPRWDWRQLGAIYGIGVSHFLIDRFGLARYVVWAKNWLGVPDQYTIVREGHKYMLDRWISRRDAGPDWKPTEPWRLMPWAACSATGYPPNMPDWLAVWLTIIADNTLHLLCNYAALRWL